MHEEAGKAIKDYLMLVDNFTRAFMPTGGTTTMNREQQTTGRANTGRTTKTPY
jgi:hypothetical protein